MLLVGIGDFLHSVCSENGKKGYASIFVYTCACIIVSIIFTAFMMFP